MSERLKDKLLKVRLTVKTENEDEVFSIAEKIKSFDEDELKLKIEEIISQATHVSYKNKEEDE